MINAQAFLERVCYASYKLCANYLCFEYLSALDEVDEYLFVDAAVESEVVQANVTRKPNLCCGCLVETAEYAMVPCGHKCYCEQCSQRWNEVAPETFSDINPDTGDMFEADANAVRTNQVKCPLCRQPTIMVIKVIET